MRQQTGGNSHRAVASLPAAASLTIAIGAILAMIWASSARADAPIVGVWSFNGGKVAIQAQSSGNFVGKVVDPTRFAQCDHPVGEEMWTQIKSKADGSYWGFHQWFFSTAECVPNPTPGPSAWRVIGNEGSRFLRVCFSEPGSGIQPTIAQDGTSANATFGCVDSERISSLPKFSQATLIRHIHLPRSKGCLHRRKLRIHLRYPDNDPFQKIEIGLKSGQLYRKATIRRHRHSAIAVLNLEGLPKPTFTLRVKVTTVLGHTLSQRRKYRRCAPGSPHAA
jgi:hypothetical protein